MRPPRVVFTVRRMMLFVAAFAASTALGRVTPAVGITAAVLLVLALIRSFEVIDRLHALGRLMTPALALGTFLSSIGVAAGIFVGSCFPALVSYELAYGSRPTSCNGPLVSEIIMPMCVAAAVGLLFACLLRRRLW
jgi:hypothetical protein